MNNNIKNFFNSKRGFIIDTKILYQQLINEKINIKTVLNSKSNLKNSFKNLNKNKDYWKNLKRNLFKSNEEKIKLKSFRNLDKIDNNKKIINKNKSENKLKNFIKYNKTSIKFFKKNNNKADFKLTKREVEWNNILINNKKRIKKNTQNHKSLKLGFGKEKLLDGGSKNIGTLKNLIINDNKLRIKRKNISNKIKSYNKSSNNLICNLKYNIFDDYNFKYIIGKGNFSEVRLAYDKKNDNFKAVKILKKYQVLNRQIFKLYYNEKKILSNLNFKYIIKFHFLYENLERIFIFLDYFKSFDWKEYLKNRKIKYNQLIDIIKKLAQTINYLHNNNVIHRDIKLENVLINNQDEIKLIDFGFSYINKEKNSINELNIKDMVTNKENNKINEINIGCGTPLYISPEVLNNNLGGKESDIWSFGILIYRIIFGKFPFFSNNLKELCKKIKYDKLILPKININKNEIINKIIVGSLEKDLNKRYKIIDILNLLEKIN